MSETMTHELCFVVTDCFRLFLAREDFINGLEGRFHLLRRSLLACGGRGVWFLAMWLQIGFGRLFFIGRLSSVDIGFSSERLIKG